MRLLIWAGQSCHVLLDERIRGVECNFVQVDQIWTFVKKRQKQLRQSDPYEYGDRYVFVAIDAETKLIPSFRVGKRDSDTALYFKGDLRKRIQGRIQLTSDAFVPYVRVVEDTFGADVDYGQLVKIFGNTVEPGRERYSPSRISGTDHSKLLEILTKI
ncbi:MAG: hypothetical protein HY644_11075 [Acidobacteria bacterium]|nr:hypothetical protein [Acidobacteriota bacterium]